MNQNPNIQSALSRIERERRVRVLYAAEAGSRAWGFASRDSGHDVRFIYTHADSGSGHDDIVETGGGIALHGVEAGKALRLLHESDPLLREALKSPLIYRADAESVLFFGHVAAQGYDASRVFQHYLQQARDQYRVYLEGDTIRLDDCLNALRPLLACRWIERGLGPVPIRFDTLANRVVEGALARIHIAVLVARKRAGEEDARALRVPIVTHFIEKELVRHAAPAPRPMEDLLAA